jgi:adenylate cyclase
MNRLSDTLVKKGRLLKGFSSFVSDSVAQDILSTGDHSYSGDSKKVAIMMADIRNFTTLSSQMKPQDVVDLLNVYFSDMIEVFVENGIIVDKFIGDGILAYAVDEGSPVVYENMLKAAFDMQLKLVQTNIKLKKRNLPKIQLGIGLHEGTVILGSIGSKDKLQYTIIGDPVNVAARLEGLCKEKQVGLIVSSHFLSKVNSKHYSKFTNFGLQKIRGLDLPIEVHGALAYEVRKHSSVA